MYKMCNKKLATTRKLYLLISV